MFSRLRVITVTEFALPKAQNNAGFEGAPRLREVAGYGASDAKSRHGCFRLRNGFQMTWRDEYRTKRMSAALALRAVQSGARIAG
jgi:hypothetical protein